MLRLLRIVISWSHQGVDKLFTLLRTGSEDNPYRYLSKARDYV